MKILVIQNSLGRGGAETYTVGLMNQFIKKGHIVELIVLSDVLSLSSELNKEIRMLAYPRHHKLDWAVIGSIRKEVKSFLPDLIISSYPIYSKLACVFYNYRGVCFYPIHTNTKSLLTSILCKLKRSNEFFLTSVPKQTETYEKAYHLGCQYYEILNGVDCSLYTLPDMGFNRGAFLQRYGIPDSAQIILLVAGYRPVKKHTDAFASFKLLQHKIPNSFLVCIGNDPFAKSDSFRMIAAQTSDHIKILTSVSGQELLNFYWSATIFTLTSESEAFPISALEAMATGLPCVLTNVGGNSNFIRTGFNGELSIAGNIPDIADKWEHVLKNKKYYIPESIREDIVAKYSIESSANRYINLAEQTTNK